MLSPVLSSRARRRLGIPAATFFFMSNRGPFRALVAGRVCADARLAWVSVAIVGRLMYLL